LIEALAARYLLERELREGETAPRRLQVVLNWMSEVEAGSTR
jgi:hypothetical protein